MRRAAWPLHFLMLVSGHAGARFCNIGVTALKLFRRVEEGAYAHRL